MGQARQRRENPKPQVSGQPFEVEVSERSARRLSLAIAEIAATERVAQSIIDSAQSSVMTARQNMKTVLDSLCEASGYNLPANDLYGVELDYDRQVIKITPKQVNAQGQVVDVESPPPNGAHVPDAPSSNGHAELVGARREQ